MQRVALRGGISGEWLYRQRHGAER